jgi:hypothetical protein
MTQNPLDFWDERIQTLKKWRKLYPNHAPLIYKVQKNFESMQIDHIKLLQDFHYRKSKTSLEKAEKIQNEADQQYKRLLKLELIAALSK